MRSVKQIDEELVNRLIRGLDERKAERIMAWACEDKIPYTEFIILCSATSSIHSQALAKYIFSFFKEAGIPSINPTKHIDKSSWLILDHGEIVTHLFYGESREKYNLGEIYKSLRSF